MDIGVKFIGPLAHQACCSYTPYVHVSGSAQPGWGAPTPHSLQTERSLAVPGQATARPEYQEISVNKVEWYDTPHQGVFTT